MNLHGGGNLEMMTIAGKGMAGGHTSLVMTDPAGPKKRTVGKIAVNMSIEMRRTGGVRKTPGLRETCGVRKIHGIRKNL
eukprot:6459718-Amphidinium_carterae.1